MRNHPNRDAPKGHPDRKALDKAEDICMALDDARKTQALSLRELSRRSGMSAEYICSAISAPKNMALTTIYRLADAVGLDVRISLVRRTP
jgi:DNA-binding phage protein